MVIKAKQAKLSKASLFRILKLFKRRLKEEGIPFAKLLLFGSYARGKPDIDSDIDVAVVISSKVSYRDRNKLNLISWFAKQIHVKLEPHLLSTTDMNNPWLSIPAELRKVGIVV